MTSSPAHSDPLARSMAWLRSEAHDQPSSHVCVVLLDYIGGLERDLVAAGERIEALEEELSDEQDQYSELFAECGGVSSPPWIPAAPKEAS